MAKTKNGYRIITDNYPTLKDYVKDWFILLLQVISRLEYTWQNLRKEKREEFEWYDRIFGASHRTSVLLSAKDNRKTLRAKRSTTKQKVIQTIKCYDEQIKKNLKVIQMNEKYRELENEQNLITKILREEIDIGFMEKLVTSMGASSR